MSLPLKAEENFQAENKKLTRQEIKIFSLSAIGGSLEFYDFVVYVYFASIMSNLFFQTNSPVTGLILSYSVFASGYFARLLGGIVFSHFGDKKGRKNSFALTVFLMALPTFIIGCLPTYSQIGIFAPILLVLCRFIQGLAIGGEIPCSLTFIYEHAQKSNRGLSCGALFCGVTFGTFLGSSVGFILTKFMHEETLNSWGWRIPFLIGGVLGLIAVYLRGFLNETPVFKKMKNEVVKIPLKEVFQSHKLTIIQTTTGLWVVAVAVSLFLLYLPNYLKTYYFYQSEDILRINSIAVLLYSILTLGFGIVCDKIGPKKVLNFSCILFIFFSYPVFLNFSQNNFLSIYLCYLLASVATSAATASSMYLLIQSFPAKIRYSGASFSYNLAFAIFGGLTPLIVTSLIEKTGSTIAPAYFIVFVSIIALSFSLFKPYKQYD